MDAQRKKGILDVCVLAVLKKGPSYGYMIIRDISRCIEISESTLYPILKRLEQNGSLQTYRKEYNGRTRKYYELTETGQHRIDVFLEEWDEVKTIYQFVEEENRHMPVQEEAESFTEAFAETGDPTKETGISETEDASAIETTEAEETVSEMADMTAEVEETMAEMAEETTEVEEMMAQVVEETMSEMNDTSEEGEE